MTSPNNAVNTTLTGQSGTGAFAGTANTTFTGVTVANDINVGNTTGPQANATGFVQAVGISPNTGNFVAASYINAAGSSPTYWTYKSRSTTVGAFTTVQTGDTLGRNLFFADDGSAFLQAAAMVCTAEGVVGAGFVPARLTWSTANSAGTVTLGMTLDSTQTLTLANALPVTSGGTGITAFGTGVATALGQNVNGSGAISLTTSPTFVTPILGAATATSINFGGTTLSSYVENTFLPTFTAATVGDLSVAYATQNGYYTRIGRMVFVQVDLVCTPTFTTASGQIRIGNLPFTINASAPPPSGEVATSAGFVYAGTVTTQMTGVAGQTYANIRLNASASNGVIMLMSNIVTGVAIEVTFTLAYLI